jgi:nitric oxide reductase NorD protein
MGFLDWEEGLFVALRRAWRVFAPPTATLPAPSAGLSTLASLVAGRPVRVVTTTGAATLRGDEILLPAGVDEAIYAVAGGAALAARPIDDHAAAGAIVEFARAWDGLRVKLDTAHRLGAPVTFRVEAPPRSGSADAGEELSPPPSSSAEVAPSGPLRVHDLAAEQPLAVPVHTFEKVEMAEPFQGTLRQLDGEDDLSDHLESLQEVPLGDLLRGGPQAHAMLRADVTLDAEVPDVADIAADEQFVATDEWDRGAGRYRKGWCRVYPTPIQGRPTAPAWGHAALGKHRRTIQRLEVEVARHRARFAACPRQRDGEDVDVEALTEAWATLRAGRTPDPRVYLRQARSRRDVATTVLLDLSLSTDAWVADRRVLDVAREATLVLGEVAERLGDRLQVLAFASHTRHKVRVWRVRGWEEPWSRGRALLGQLSPQGYTRIGPALRYAVDDLARVDARQRLLLLISDGKPTDYDRYEGRYGVADVRRALAEARGKGVHPYAITIDERARAWLPAMFGPGAWSVVRRPEELPQAMVRAWAGARG